MGERSSSRVGAVVLAAGRSTRMGEPKQLLRVGEQTVLERTLSNVRGSGVDEIVLVLGFLADRIRHEVSPALLEGVRVVENPEHAEGMAGSVRIGLSALTPQTGAALFVLADQPFVRSVTLDRIIERYRSSDAGIVVPFYKGQRGNPVLLDRAIFPDAIELEGDVGFRAIFARHADSIVPVEVEDEGVLLDLDDKSDYERLRGHVG
jgi:molybdenum cofactor cytidylyltransferase